MRNGTMACLPLACARTVAGCSGAVKDAARHDGGRDGPPAHVGPIATQDYALTGFTGVEVTGPDDVTIRRGDAFSISARRRQDALDRLEIKRDGDRMSLGRKPSGWSFRSRRRGGEGTGVSGRVDLGVWPPRTNINNTNT